MVYYINATLSHARKKGLDKRIQIYELRLVGWRARKRECER